MPFGFNLTGSMMENMELARVKAESRVKLLAVVLALLVAAGGVREYQAVRAPGVQATVVYARSREVAVDSLAQSEEAAKAPEKTVADVAGDSRGVAVDTLAQSEEAAKAPEKAVADVAGDSRGVAVDSLAQSEEAAGSHTDEAAVFLDYLREVNQKAADISRPASALDKIILPEAAEEPAAREEIFEDGTIEIYDSEAGVIGIERTVAQGVISEAPESQEAAAQEEASGLPESQSVEVQDMASGVSAKQSAAAPEAANDGVAGDDIIDEAVIADEAKANLDEVAAAAMAIQNIAVELTESQSTATQDVVSKAPGEQDVVSKALGEQGAVSRAVESKAVMTQKAASETSAKHGTAVQNEAVAQKTPTFVSLRQRESDVAPENVLENIVNAHENAELTAEEEGDDEAIDMMKEIAARAEKEAVKN